MAKIKLQIKLSSNEMMRQSKVMPANLTAKALLGTTHNHITFCSSCDGPYSQISPPQAPIPPP